MTPVHAKPNTAGRSSPPSRQMLPRIVAMAFVAMSALALDSKGPFANPTGTKLAVGVTSGSSVASPAGQNANEGSTDSLTLFGARTTIPAATSNIGIHDIVQGSVTASSNDTFAFVDGNLMPAAATPTYLADSPWRDSDDANTVLAASMNGFTPAQASRGSTQQRNIRRCFPVHRGGILSYGIVGDAMWPAVGARLDFGRIRSPATDTAGR